MPSPEASLYISRAFSILPAITLSPPSSFSNKLTTRGSCIAPADYYCCEQDTSLACQNGFECDVGNKQCIKRPNVAIIVGFVAVLLVVIGTCVALCVCCARKRRREKALQGMTAVPSS
ncbi:hypothetical protein HDU97_004919 [Phlyctochytrium planicorne]|nr:hypothetical protein HDU97_004919 [Phlyctochytrium planicorne]